MLDDSSAPPTTLLELRVQGLVRHFVLVQHERMGDVPVLNPHLHVQALGFEPARDRWGQPQDWAEGLLITPWFMSLVRLPLGTPRLCADGPLPQVRTFGQEAFDFLPLHIPGQGWVETASLFSPMNDFADQAQAIATAQAVLALLRQAPANDTSRQATTTDKGMPATAVPGAVTSRRAFLTGRRA